MQKNPKKQDCLLLDGESFKFPFQVPFAARKNQAQEATIPAKVSKILFHGRTFF